MEKDGNQSLDKVKTQKLQSRLLDNDYFRPNTEVCR